MNEHEHIQGEALIKIKELLKSFLRSVLGLEVSLARKRPAFPKKDSDAMKLVSSFRKFGVDLVFDVGANKGQFASEIRKCGYMGRILSFEPLKNVHSELVLASASDPLWEAYPLTALGSENGLVEINVAGNTESSSILPMLELHSRTFPESTYLGREVVPVITLDSVAGEYIASAHAPFLKIDTQGFEWQVLDGALETLPLIKGILVELSLVPLYEGQHMWREVMERIEKAGFRLWAFNPVIYNESDGQTLQVDGIFYRVT